LLLLPVVNIFNTTYFAIISLGLTRNNQNTLGSFIEL